MERTLTKSWKLKGQRDAARELRPYAKDREHLDQLLADAIRHGEVRYESRHLPIDKYARGTVGDGLRKGWLEPF
jgi:hypothetical protein